jgi:alkanesulfonate monooxygenase SsuD/methylene tetrahydromethanopterin reductase-like flavin-dependent oxidoreductase (luciferase family)
MEFCLSIEIQEGMTYADTLAMTQAGEAAGFHAALLAEHYYASSGRPELMSADAWIFLGALARETSRIRLGTLVSPVTFRHPAVLAKLAASLDHVSEGRAELGIGAGWLPEEHKAYGFPFPAGPRRVDLLEEQLQIITGLFAQDPFSFSGAHYQIDNCHFTPRPVQERLPIIVGGDAGATRLPRLAARYADEYVIGRGTTALCRDVRDRLDRDCERAGREPSAVSLALFAGLCVAETEAEVQRLLAKMMEGARPHMQDTSTWIMGTPEQAAERLRDLAAAGVKRLMFSVDNDLHREMLPLLGERVKPLV